MSLKQENGYSGNPLLEGISEIKAWMSINFLHFNNNKTEVMLFGPSRTTRLDYCNALYAGLSQASLTRLQLVQNAAAHLLTGSKQK